MHVIEPFFSWRHHYIASEDPRSPFYGRTYSEIEFSHAIYNYLIHPQWDLFGSATLVAKILYADYDHHFAVIELMGEWNDTLYNDIMYLKHNLLDPMIHQEINRFILIGENVLNFHAGDDDYYQELFDDLESDGYIFAVGFQNHVVNEFLQYNLGNYIIFPDEKNNIPLWRTFTPLQLKQFVES